MTSKDVRKMFPCWKCGLLGVYQPSNPTACDAPLVIRDPYIYTPFVAVHPRCLIGVNGVASFLSDVPYSELKCVRICDVPTHVMQKIVAKGRIARARKAGSTVTKKKSAASRANLAKGRRKMDPAIKKIMSERGVTRQRAHQIRNADLAEINKELGELFDGVKKLRRK